MRGSTEKEAPVREAFRHGIIRRRRCRCCHGHAMPDAPARALPAAMMRRVIDIIDYWLKVRWRMPDMPFFIFFFFSRMLPPRRTIK